MNQLTKELQEILLPRAVLVAYTYESSPYGGRQKFHLELRPVDGGGKMGAAVPVSQEFMNTLVENCSVETDSIPHGQLPPTMFWCDTRRGHGKYVWYNPPGRRRMYFKESLHIEDGEFNLPGIIYVVEKDRLNVHAFKGERPEAGDRLYKAPYFNTNATSGGVCLGNASLQAPQNPTFNQWLEYWEKRFWMSEFSHLGAGGNPTRSNLVLVTEKARNAPFDESELKLSGKQLKDLLT